MASRVPSVAPPVPAALAVTVAAALLALAVVVFVLPASAVPDVQLTVSEVAVEPDEPVPGDTVTVSATLASSVGSNQPATVDSATLRIDGETVDEVTDLGTLSPGDTLTASLAHEFDEPGTYDAEVEFEGTDADGETVSVTSAAPITVSAVSDVRLTVSDVGVEPETPTAGAPLTVPVTVESSTGSVAGVVADRVELRDGNETLVEATDLGELSVSDGLDVELTHAFEEPGVYNLTVAFEGTNENGDAVGATRPLTVAVEEGAPVSVVRSGEAVEGVPTDLTVLVANPTEGTLRNVDVSVSGDALEPVVDRQLEPALGPGETANLTFEAVPAATGDVAVNASVGYTTLGGTEATAVNAGVLAVEPAETAVDVRVAAVEGEPDEGDDEIGVDVPGLTTSENGDEPAGDLRVTVANLGNTPLTDVVVDPVVGDTSFGARPVTAELTPGEEASVGLSVEELPPGEVRFETSYEVAGERETTVTEVDPAPDRELVAVTGVDLSLDGEEVLVTGDVGNRGATPADGVVVAVGDGEEVSPAYPSRDFFVGAVDGNEFVPFELTATLGENATELPVEVTYLVGGEERTETVSLPVEPEETDDALPVGWLAGLGLVVALAAAVVGYALWRR